MPGVNNDDLQRSLAYPRESNIVPGFQQVVRAEMAIPVQTAYHGRA